MTSAESPSFEIHFPDQTRLRHSFTDLASLPVECRIEDVSRVDARRKGTAIRLAALLEDELIGKSKQVRLVSEEKGFEVKLPIEIAVEQGMILYQLDGEPLPVEKGGAFRFLLPDTVSCKTADLPSGVLDNCANLKHLVLIELTID